MLCPCGRPVSVDHSVARRRRTMRSMACGRRVFAWSLMMHARAALERRGVFRRVHHQNLARQGPGACACLTPNEQISRADLIDLQLCREGLVPRAHVLGCLSIYPFSDPAPGREANSQKGSCQTFLPCPLLSTSVSRAPSKTLRAAPPRRSAHREAPWMGRSPVAPRRRAAYPRSCRGSGPPSTASGPSRCRRRLPAPACGPG